MERLNTADISRRATRAQIENHHDATKVLLLDDDDASLRLMHGVLQSAGYDCIATHRAQEALEIVAQHSDVKVVVSDICMPEIDGLMFLDRLRQLRGESQLPQVLFLTGHPSLDNAVAALRRGAVDFLMKPLRPKELLAAVDRACERAAQLAPTAAVDNSMVEHLAIEAEQLADRLRKLTPATIPREMRAAPAEQTSSGTNASEAPSQQRTERLLDTMEELRRLRRRYHALLGELDDVAWELLVETLRSQREGKQISVSGLSISLEGVSSTTALRRVNELVARGHLHRIPDPTDARRDFVVLDAKTREALDDYLARVAVQLDKATQG